ncbi:hypothetical protein [Pseudoalteromonas piscicida]|uniref:hypothetical protein n=1 Tax=Pseudoalteromonas piscicida TaxID=43662 RepID=UPI003C7CB9BD
MFEGTFDLKNEATQMLVQGICELSAYDGIDSAVQELGISRQAGVFITELTVCELYEFCLKLSSQKAVELKVNFNTATKLAELVAELNLSQLQKLNVSTQLYVKSLGARFEHDQLLASKFLGLLSGAMEHAERAPSNYFMFPVPSELIVVMQRLQAVHLNLYMRLLIQKNVVGLEVDSAKIDRVVASMKIQLQKTRPIRELIAAGADLSFVRKYTGVKHVSSKLYTQCRMLYGAHWQIESITAKDCETVYEQFKSMVQSRASVVKIYLGLHHTFGYRIETLYQFIQKTLVSEFEHDDYQLNLEVSKLLND